MKQCKCGACRWMTVKFPSSADGEELLCFRCLKCYETYERHELLKLKDKKTPNQPKTPPRGVTRKL